MKSVKVFPEPQGNDAFDLLFAAAKAWQFNLVSVPIDEIHDELYLLPEAVLRVMKGERLIMLSPVAETEGQGLKRPFCGEREPCGKIVGETFEHNKAPYFF